MAMTMSILESRTRNQDNGSDTEEARMKADTIEARGFLGPILSTPADGVRVHYTLLYYDTNRLIHVPLLYIRDGNVTLNDDVDQPLARLPHPDSSCDFGSKDECTSILAPRKCFVQLNYCPVFFLINTEDLLPRFTPLECLCGTWCINYGWWVQY